MDPKIKVLIVDDDKFLLSMYSTKFQKAGHDVSVAGGATEALSKLKEEGYAPLILDVIMPGMDGLELLTEIKKEHLADKAVVVILSNQGESSDIEKAKQIGIHGYIVKATSIPSEVVEEVMKIYNEHKGSINK
jgi:CheY-like chemotaxis protein